MRLLPAEILRLRSDFLRSVRTFFHTRGFLELETPLLVSGGTTEPFIDNVELQNPVGGQSAYLITSPEANLKITLSELQGPLFQIAHVWRARDCSPLHTQEFLMLEWYSPGLDDFGLMSQLVELVRHLILETGSPLTGAEGFPAAVPILSIGDLMARHAGCGFDRPSLEEAARRLGLAEPVTLRNDRYDELFFRVFLECVEPQLQTMGPVFIHGYPPELAAYSRIENGIGRRFEFVWNGVELANGYLEVTDPREQTLRAEQENAIRRQIGKVERLPDPEWIRALERGIPDCAGVAVGLERLLMVLSGADRIEEVSPFA